MLESFEYFSQLNAPFVLIKHLKHLIFIKFSSVVPSSSAFYCFFRCAFAIASNSIILHLIAHRCKRYFWACYLWRSVALLDWLIDWTEWKRLRQMCARCTPFATHNKWGFLCLHLVAPPTYRRGCRIHLSHHIRNICDISKFITIPAGM